MKTDPMIERARIARQKEVLDLMASQQWEAVLLDLVKYAVTLIKKNTWLSVWSGPLPAGKEAHDMVMDSVFAIIDGDRNADEGVPLIAFLKKVISGKVNKLAESWENRKWDRIDSPGSSGGVDASGLSDGRTTGEAQSRDTARVNAELLDLLVDDLNDEPDLQEIILCNMDGIYKREEIAERLGKGVSDITNMRKRLERRLSKFRETHAAKIAITKSANE
jgi:hypothetical protein